MSLRGSLVERYILAVNGSEGERAPFRNMKSQALGLVCFYCSTCNCPLSNLLNIVAACALCDSAGNMCKLLLVFAVYGTKLRTWMVVESMWPWRAHLRSKCIVLPWSR